MFEPMLSLALFATGMWLGFELRDFVLGKCLDRMQRENDELREALLERLK